MTLSELIRACQAYLGVTVDGVAGAETWRAIYRKFYGDSDWHFVNGSSFADPADVAAFNRCIKSGQGENECFKVGDNGFGCWGDKTSGPDPCCALPPEEMVEQFGSIARAKHAKVAVRYKETEVICVLKDRMPARKNIKNGAGIDLNPGACKALGLRPPMLVPVQWRWV